MKRRSSWLESITFVRLISLLMGVCLWAIVHVDTAVQSTGTGLGLTTDILNGVPVQVLTAPNMVAVSVRPQVVNVNLSGSILDVAAVRVEATDVHAVANALHAGPGVHQVPVIVENVPSSSVTYAPATSFVAVDLQQRISEALTAHVLLTGAPAVGMRIASVTQNPHRVVVSGPDTLVHKVDRVVARLDVSGWSRTQSQFVTLVPLSSVGLPVSGVTCSPASVHVIVPVLEQTRRVPVIVTTTGNPAQGYTVGKVEANPSTIWVTGSSDHLKKANAITVPPINVAGWKTTHQVNVTLPIPFVGGHLSEPVAQITVQIVPLTTVQINGVPVTWIGQHKGYSYHFSSLSNSVVSVTVTGPFDAVSQLQSKDLQAYLNVSALHLSQTMTLKVGASVPVGISLKGILPATILVRATKAGSP